MAESDYKYILADPIDAMSNEAYLPKPGEQHDIQVNVLQGYLKKMTLVAPSMPDEQQEWIQNVLNALKLYIELHNQLKAQESGGAGMGAGGQPQSPMQAAQTPSMPGEAGGDIVSGLAGQVAETA